ncbi:NEP1 methyltransferase, partial [Polypterus senegalus]
MGSLTITLLKMNRHSTASGFSLPAWIFSTINSTKDPCEDILGFSCGQQLNITTMKLHNKNLNPGQQQILEILRSSLENSSTNLSSAEEKAKKFYYVCSNLSQIIAAGRLAFRETIKKIGLTNSTNIIAVLQKIMKDYNTYPFFKLNLVSDPQNTSSYAIQSNAPGINWLECLQATFESINMKPSDHIYVHDLPYLTSMSKYISEYQKISSLGSPLSTVPYQSHEKKIIYFPAGMFQEPLFGEDYPRAVYYGGVGTVIAQELIIMLADFEYQEYKDIEKKDKQEIGYTGTHFKIQAYESRLNTDWCESSLANLESLTKRQMFFVTYAQIICEASGKASAIEAEFRVKVGPATGVKYQIPDVPKVCRISYEIMPVWKRHTVGKTFELLNCDKHKNIILKSGRDLGSVRPDITHQSLLMLMDSPLNRAGLLQVYIHTQQNILIEINPQTRIPRTFDLQLLHKLSVRASDGPDKLLKVIKNPILDHLPVGSMKIGTSFSSQSSPVNPRDLVPESEPCVIVIGAFAHGSINVDYTEKMVSISNYPLSAALTCAKVCTAFEEVWGVV